MTNPNLIASQITHEASHAVFDDDHPDAVNASSIDEEVYANMNQLSLYEEQHNSGFTDGFLDSWLKARTDGDLRRLLRVAYPYPEHIE